MSMYIVNCSWAYDEEDITIETPRIFKSYQECVSYITKEILGYGFKLKYHNYNMSTYSYDSNALNYAVFSREKATAEIYRDNERISFAIHKINIIGEVR